MSLRRFATHHRTYLLITLTTLFLSVGVHLIAFSLANALWLRPRLGTDRVVQVIGQLDSSPEVAESFFFAEAGLEGDLRGPKGLEAFEAVAGQAATAGENSDYLPRLTDRSNGDAFDTLAVTSEYFSVAGLKVRGRDFRSSDDKVGAPPVAIVSYDLWKRWFHGRDEALGSTLDTAPIPVEVIGIAPANFTGLRLGERTDVWIPRALVPRLTYGRSRGMPPLLAFARLRPGVTVHKAQELIANLRPGVRYSVVPLTNVFGSPMHPTTLVRSQPVLWAIAATATLVLLSGCTGLMAATVVHYERRRPEYSVRFSLGATAMQLLKRTVAESSALALVGGCGALALATIGLRSLPALNLFGAVDIGRLDLSLDWRIVCTALLSSFLAISCAIAIPLSRVIRTGWLNGVLTGGMAGSTHVLRIVLTGHIAITTIILIAAALFARTISHNLNTAIGYDLDRTIFVDAQVRPILRSRDEEARETQLRAAAELLIAGLKSIPGVQDIAYGNRPVSIEQATRVATVRSFAADGRDHLLHVALNDVSPNYFSVLGVPLLAGTGLSFEQGSDASVQRVVVTARLANRLWQDQVAVGRDFTGRGGTRFEVVGVVADIPQGSLQQEHSAGIFRATTHDSVIQRPQLSVVLRTMDDSARYADRVRRLVSEVFPDASRLDVATGREILSRDLGRQRLGLWFLGVFGVVTLVLGMGIVYGLVAYVAESKKKELGIRVALGATPTAIRAYLAKVGLWPTVLGLGAGVLSSAWVSRYFRSLVIGVSAFDVLSYALVPALVLGMVAIAWFAAGGRAWRKDSADTLRVP